MVLRRVDPAAGGIEAEIPWRQDQAPLPRGQCMLQLGHLKMSWASNLLALQLGSLFNCPGSGPFYSVVYCLYAHFGPLVLFDASTKLPQILCLQMSYPGHPVICVDLAAFLDAPH